jgi:hypothetical protein
VNDRFSSSWLKIARARKHIADLENEISGFWAASPYEIEEYGSPKTGPGGYRLGKKLTPCLMNLR